MGHIPSLFCDFGNLHLFSLLNECTLMKQLVWCLYMDLLSVFFSNNVGMSDSARTCGCSKFGGNTVKTHVVGIYPHELHESGTDT